MYNEYNEFYVFYFQQIFMILIFCVIDEVIWQLRFVGVDKCRDFGVFEDIDLLKVLFFCVLLRKVSFLYCFLYVLKSCFNVSFSDLYDRG